MLVCRNKKERPAVQSVSSSSYIVTAGALLVAAVVALSAALAVVVSEDDGATKQPCDKGRDGLEKGEGLAQVPLALVDFIADVVALPEGADRKRRLAIPPDMLEKLNGKCTTLDQYKPSKNTNYWQCNQNKNTPIYPDANNEKIGRPYKPADDVLALLASATGASLSSLQNMRIGSGQPLAPAGSWCGMPGQGEAQLENGTITPQGQLAHDYWLRCVSPRAGYFNVLQCGGDCDENEDNCSTYAVLGYAALDANVCYPAHQHQSEEAYWQIGGHGWWRTWKNVAGLEDYDTVSNDNFGGSKYAFHPHRSGVPHEMDTTSNLDNDGGAGHLAAPMVMAYWWGLDTDVANNYHWADQVRDNPFKYETSAQTCGNKDRIPYHNENLTQTINNDNC